MRYFQVLLKKELKENIRTHKLMIMLVVFSIFGLLSPLTAVFTPDILKSFLPEGMEIKIPEPVWTDSWAQFFKKKMLHKWA
ncbi:MAG: hypothetical protein GX383_08445 [Clostridium sp.]|jgi:ABC-2 type transport system permease protein|nr:hypothetical protein [Clostridium sp.]